MTILDRLYHSAQILWMFSVQGGERHFLVRAKSTWRFKLVEELADGSRLVTLYASAGARRKNPGMPRTVLVRAVPYSDRDHNKQFLFTSLLDPEKYPAEEIRGLYHKRWEIEIAWSELKVTMKADDRPLRSKAPAGVLQELWGLWLAYNLVRVDMVKLADRLGVEPLRLSFKRCLQQTELAVLPLALVGKLPSELDDVSHLLNPPRRPGRRYPRLVKSRASRFSSKTPHRMALFRLKEAA